MEYTKILDESSPLPLYHQLKVLLKKKIESGVWKTGKKIPSEKELASIYSTSMTTVRQAVALLTNEGLLVKKQGKGTFVATAKIQKGPILLTSFTEEMQSKGFKVKSKVLRFGRVNPNDVIRRTLNLPEDEKVFLIQRLRYANDEPMGLQSSYIVLDIAEGLENEDLSGSLYQILEHKYGVVIAKANENYSAMLLDKNTEKLLGLPHPAVGFSVKRIAYSAKNRPIEYTESFMRADRYSISIKLQRHTNTSIR